MRLRAERRRAAGVAERKDYVTRDGDVMLFRFNILIARPISEDHGHEECEGDVGSYHCGHSELVGPCRSVLGL